jgi:hypothetical protein
MVSVSLVFWAALGPPQLEEVGASRQSGGFHRDKMITPPWSVRNWR